MSIAPNRTRVLSRARCLARLAAFVAATLLLGVPRWSMGGGTTQPTTFASVTEAAEALFQAVRKGDRHAIEAILGSKDDLASCDESRDARERARFVEKYQEMHRLARARDGTVVLFIGAESWPFPIPLVSRGKRWHFDAVAGRREVTFRRIGADEATAIEVSRAAVEAACEERVVFRRPRRTS